MKAVFVACNQGQFEDVLQTLKRLGLRGYTSWEELQGCGLEGEPHLGDAAWPTMNSALLTFIPDEKKDELMKCLKELDEASPKLGLKAFWWEIGGSF